MRKHIKFPSSFHALTPGERFAAQPGLPLAPVEHASLIPQYGWNIVRCPYCKQEHATYNEPLDGTPDVVRAICMERYGEFKMRVVTIELHDFIIERAEIDHYFPLVAVAYNTANRPFQLIRDRWDGLLYRVLPIAGQSKGSRRQRIPYKVRRTVWWKTEGRCGYCGELETNADIFQIDHIIPVASGGTNDIHNLILACPSCNRSKHAMSLGTFRGRRGGDPFWFETKGGRS